MNKNYKKGTALITGSSRGIGRATALRLASDGFNIVINYHSKESRNKVASLENILKNQRRKYLTIQADISKESEVRMMIAKIEKKFGSLDVLVNNAGINQNQSIELLNSRDSKKIMDTNLLGPILATKYSLPILRKSKNPRVIFISSTNFFCGSSEKLAYTVSKGGVVALARCLALELAPKIMVNTIVPGYINTSMIKKLGSKSLKERAKEIPLKRIGKPEEIASVVSFLCSDDASYITGQCLHINGGLFFS
jgi:3-oxoacyl-[acyl-carrier protein] reductase